VTPPSRVDILVVDDDADVPKAVLLDIMMPTMSGWQLLERLRLDPALSRLPVCVISASVNKGEALPNVTVLPKPIDVEHLLAFVRQHCHQETAAIG
jgi:CheY-like chemotaxis protein